MKFSFDDQAEQYDERAGLAAGVPDQITEAIERLAAAPAGGLLLEVGAGTGQIGRCLRRLPLRYVGFDISTRMLARFRDRFTANEALPDLHQADGNGPWPVGDGSVDVIFSSRTLHLLDSRHVVNELFRVAALRGAVLLTGHVQREPDAVSAVMRNQMRRLLRDHGYEGRSSSDARQAIFEACRARGAQPIEKVVAANWSINEAPLRSIQSWQGKSGLAGIDVPPAVKENILSQLRSWASRHYNGLDHSFETDEEYVIEGVRLTPTCLASHQLD